MLAERVLGRKVELRGVGERIGEGGKGILLIIMEKEMDRDALLERVERRGLDEGREEVRMENRGKSENGKEKRKKGGI
ncbi:hypothetical protein RF55_16127 [Lasius niger]|uniref:Uncharacterized protein n=1 Tax=Lasius niger TaxID=67767 RepID=A0A0J7K4H3_LASNI|nr:hypothetical protein RF55_16127 [Lasius niger]